MAVAASPLAEKPNLHVLTVRTLMAIWWWDEFMRRSAMYKEQEAEAMAKHKCRMEGMS